MEGINTMKETLKQNLSKCTIKQLQKLHKIINSDKIDEYIDNKSQKDPKRIAKWNKLIRKEILKKQGIKANKKRKNKGVILSKSKVQRIV